jgi:hypothetical protein
MKALIKWMLLIMTIVVFALPGTARAQGGQGDKFVTGGTYTLAGGETLDGSLYILGGSVTLQAGSRVRGDVTLAGGSLHANGQIDGDILATGGSINLGGTGIVEGNVSTLGGTLNYANRDQIKGEISSNLGGPFPLRLPNSLLSPDFRINLNPLWSGLWLILRSFLWAGLAVLVVLFIPKQTERVTQAVVSQPLIAGGLGLLTVIVYPLLLLVLVVTIIGIPISLLGVVALAVTWAFGVIAVGIEVGNRLGQGFHQDWAPAAAAGVGTFILTLVVNGIDMIPCVGWLAPALVGVVGLGAVLLTRFGTQAYLAGAPHLSTPSPTPPTGAVAPLPPVAAQPMDRSPEQNGEENLPQGENPTDQSNQEE